MCSLLALVDLDVPLAPDLGRGEHATGTAHVTEGGLTGTVSTTTRDTRDTGDGTTFSAVSNLLSKIFCQPLEVAVSCTEVKRGFPLLRG